MPESIGERLERRVLQFKAADHARTYLQLHDSNVYLSAGQN